MSQTNYDEQSKALDGMKGHIGPDTVTSFAAEGANGIEFGRLVVRGTDKEKQCKLPAAALDITSLKAKLGVALQTHAIENPKDGSAPKYPQYKTVSVLEKGTVYVKVEDAVTVDSDVYVNFQNGDEGLFRSDAGGGDAAQLADARWREGAGAGEYALLELL